MNKTIISVLDHAQKEHFAIIRTSEGYNLELEWPRTDSIRTGESLEECLNTLFNILLEKRQSVVPVSYREVKCLDYKKGIRFLLNESEIPGQPIKEWKEYKAEGSDEKVVIVTTPANDLWTFMVKKADRGYSVELIGSTDLIDKEFLEDVE